ncbi:MAG: hypothetical protein IJ008_03920 [Clostridia bacterium]|nr:hypothetical protein [Clostridia bacterium]
MNKYFILLQNICMRTSTKILIILTIISFIPMIILSKYVFSSLTLTTKTIDFDFNPLSISGLVFSLIFTILFSILYIRFLKSIKLSKSIFFATIPVTIYYAVGIYLLADLKNINTETAKVVKTALNINSTTNSYNNILWSILFTIIYLLIVFVTIAMICKPLSKVQKYAHRLGDGRLYDDEVKIGGSKQFKEIEYSLNKINYNYKEKDNLLKKTNLETQKFIPKQFLKFLGKNNISELELGNQVQKKATTLFCDMNSSTNMSKTLSLEENFNYINSYLHTVSPLIRRYDGFIDKYMGDGILAVFSKPQNAIECSLAIVRAIEIKNKSQKDLPNIDVRISINTGEVIFGIVGEEERKSPTIISDVVNLASKMEEINKYIGTKIIFSKETLNELPSSFPIIYRYTGSLTLDGQNQLSLFENLEYYPKQKREKLIKLKGKFERGVRYYNEKDYLKSKECFEEILKYVPDDKPSYIYFNKASGKISTTS